VDINSEIKFSVVDLVLPLGIIFQENEKGCFVAKILPEGSAARTKGDVQIGDQLAAVDGTSAIDMTVDEIAKMVRVKKQVVELTFLRYIGPMRPEAGTIVQEEGYEIRASEGRGKLMARQVDSNSKLLPGKAVAQISQPKKSCKPKGILKNRTVTPPPVQPPTPKVEKKATSASPTTTAAAAAAVPAPASQSAKERKRFRFFGRKKKDQKKT